MRKWWILTALIVGGLVGFTVTRPVRRRRPQWRRLLALWVLAQLGSWWNPWSWLPNVGHIASSALRDIENWCLNAINWAFSLYDDAASLAQDAINDTFNWLYDTINFVGQVASQAWNWVQNAFDTVTGWIDNTWDWLWANVVAPVIQDVSDFAHYAWDLLSAAVQSIQAGYDWLVDDIIDPVVRWVDGADSWVWGVLTSWWNDIWASTIGPVVSEVGWLIDHVPGWIDWLTNHAFGAVGLVEESADWLIWFSENPIAGLDDESRALESAFTPQRIVQASDDTTTFIQRLEANLEDALGV